MASHLIFQCLFITVSLKPYYFVAVGGRNRKVADAYARNGGKRCVFPS